MNRLFCLIVVVTGLALGQSVSSIPAATGGGGGGGTINGCGFGQTLNGSVCDNNTVVMTSNGGLQAGAPLYCAGSASTIATCGLNPALTAYTDGQLINFKAGIANTTTYTLNIDGLGAKSILNSAGAALVSGDIASGVSYILRYDGTQFRLPAAGGSTVTVSAPYTVIGGTNYLSFGFAATIPPVIGSFTALNAGSASFTQVGNTVLLTQGASVGSWATEGIAIGSTTTLIAAVAMTSDTGGTTTPKCGVGIQRNTGNNPLIVAWILPNQFNGSYVGTDYWSNGNSSTTGGAAAGTQTGAVNASQVLFKLVLSGGNIVISYSHNGMVWRQYASVSQTTVLGSAAASGDRWVLASTNSGTTTSDCQLLSWSAT